MSAIHGFLGKLTRRDSAGSPIAVELMNPPRSKISRVAFCSWDRIGLLEQIVAAFNALRINILRADVYTRTDNLVLDVFEVCEPKAGAGRGSASTIASLPTTPSSTWKPPIVWGCSTTWSTL
ncbi:MAG: hypothetical protein MUC91_05075 [Verrucomicrobia bacterium]|nr:hypothetical protein [Verrucomicrobiota bacterium]